MNHLLKTARFAVAAGFVIGLVAPAAAAGDEACAPNWRGSATGSTKPGVGVDVDEFGGNSTQVGPFTGAGSHILNPVTGHFEGSAKWTASNGDLLKVSYSGLITPSGNPTYPFAFKGVLLADGGTGRLSRARGRAVWMGGFTGIPGNFFFTFEGTLEHTDGVTRAENFQAEGGVFFTNVLKGTQQGGIVPYFASGRSRLIESHIQTGSIRNLTGLIAVDASTFLFLGEVGPHPFRPGHPAVHLISTEDGNIFCAWTAVFTLRIVNANGNAVFSGEGDFRIVRGTGRYKHASGAFTTYFETGPVPAGSDEAFADYQQSGEFRRH